MIFFTADTHFGHKGCLKWRPWDDIDTMDADLVDVWNDIVGPRDIVYHVGDFAWKHPEFYLGALNGFIHLIKGNHDSRRVCRRMVESGLLTSVQDVFYLRHEGYRFWMSHYAQRIWPNAENGAFHLYGHYHGDGPDFNRSTDVGIDHDLLRTVMLKPEYQYAPIPWAAIVDYLEPQPNTYRHPHVAAAKG